MESFKIRVPANDVKNSFTRENRRNSSTLAHSDRGHMYYDLTEKFTPDGDLFQLEQRKYKGSDYYPHIAETQSLSLDGKCKTNEVQLINSLEEPNGKKFSSVAEIKNDGTYSVTRKVGDEIVGGYEIKPVNRKFATGFKGHVEKLAMKIGTDANGCERPVLRRVSEFMLNMLKKVR